MTDDLIAKIIYTSCCSPDRVDQPAWAWIADRKPDLFLLLGDTVYARPDGWFIDDLAEKYRVRMSDPRLRRVIDQFPTLATWDDHDLGPNNSKGDTPQARALGYTGLERRQEARLQFLSHLSPRGVDPTRLTHPKGGIYCSYELNGVLVIVLDGRYFRQDILENGADAQFLGEAQEAWLWDQLQRAQDGDYLATVVACGSTINSSKQLGEDVSHYRRFYQAFEPRFKACPNPIFLSGDIHRNAYVRHDGFVEGIASGIAQTRRRRVSDVFPDGREEIDNFGELRIYADRAVFEFCITDYGVIEETFPIGYIYAP